MADDDHEVRKLRYKVKELSKQCGKQGARIYQLRCALTEALSLAYVDRRDYRDLLDSERELKAERDELQEQVRVLEEKLRGDVDKVEAGMPRRNRGVAPSLLEGLA